MKPRSSLIWTQSFSVILNSYTHAVNLEIHVWELLKHIHLLPDSNQEGQINQRGGVD